MINIYDFIVIGSGISACTFTSCINKRFSDASILLVEQGRRLGGRATTRKSRRNKIFEFDHGLPSISFSKYISQDIKKIIEPLINSKKLVDISNDILMINELGQMNHISNNDRIYRSLPFMINFSEEIINQSINPKKINFLFQTITKSIKRINNLWEVKVNNDMLVKSRNLIISNSLIAHPRCLKILNRKTLPLRDAFIKGEDEVVESVLKETKKQTHIKRKVYIFHVSNIALIQNINYKYLQIFFSDVIRKNFNFERIIFQKQSDSSMIIVLHCYYIKNLFTTNIHNIVQSLVSIFHNYQIFNELFFQAKVIDQMDWRASQPLDHLLSKELQWSPTSRIGFCGDWVDSHGCVGVESGMNSSIRLARLLNLD